MDENRNSYMYDVSASTIQTDGEIKVQAVVDNNEGYIPFGSITPSEITSTTQPTATVILTITSSQGIEVDLSQITITITRREPVEITDFTFSLRNTNYTVSVTDYTGSDTTVTIPSSVTTIGSNAFSSCSQLTSVDFGDNSQLESIGFLAFRYCELLEITIPSSVTSIEIQAFLETGLTTVTIEGETIYNSATSSSACGRLLQYATAVRVLADFARDDHEYINLTNYTSVDKNVVIDGKTYWVYTK